MATVILWGPPCSGKSTYIRERAKPGDVVIDLDRLALALMPEGSEHHEYPEVVRSLARRARMAIVDQAAGWGRTGPGTAWIIDSNASAQARARWRSVGAHVVKLNVSMATCLDRAATQRPAGTDKRIREWFAKHGSGGAVRAPR